MIDFIKKHKESLLLVLILVLAFFLRFWRLGSIPPGLYPDIAANGTDAIRAIQTHHFQVFYLTNNGREGLFINLIALSFLIFGVSVWSIKIVSALFGFFTVLGTYLLGKELFNKKVALFSSFFIAVSFWHVNFSRMGFRAIVLPFVLVYSFYFFFRGIRKNSWFDFILGGLFFGLGFHTYISWRLAPAIIVVWILAKIILDRKFWHTYWPKILVFIVSSILAALPLLYYFLLHPADFMGRAGDVSVFKQPGALKLILINSFKALAMFNIYGDYNWRHNLSGAPIFTIPLGLLFLGGLVLTIVKLFKDFKKRDNNKFFIYLFLLLWFAVMLSPTILSSEGIPHALRAIGVIPVCLIFAGFFTYWLFKLKFWTKFSKQIKIIMLIVLLVLIGGLEFNRYFFAWVRSTEVSGAFTENLVNMGDYLNSLPTQNPQYVVVNEGGVLADNLPMPAQTVKFITYNKSNPTYLLPDDLKNIKTFPKGSVIAFMDYDKNLLSNLKDRFPTGQIEKIDLQPGNNSEFFIFKVN